MGSVPHRSLLDTLESASKSGNGVRFIHGKSDDSFMPYGELHDRALRLLGSLQRAGVAPKSEVILQLEDPKEFLTAFWACIAGGMIPVPLSIGTNDEHRHKVLKVWEVLTRPYLVSTKKSFSYLKEHCAESHPEVVREMEGRNLLFKELAEGKEHGVRHGIQADDVAFLQFSSGSTGLPKGVMLTHRNVIVNALDGAKVLDYSSKDVFLTWVPLTHDLGMVGFHLMPIVYGAAQNLMLTSLFVRAPSLWLDKASEHRATVLTSPNFGYRHLLRSLTPELIAGWDLSPVRNILNGAEPISSTLMEEFLTALAPAGLSPLVMRPGYGMAESSLMTTMTPIGEGTRSRKLDRRSLGVGSEICEVSEGTHAVDYVEVGVPLEHVEVRITDDARSALADGVVGNIEIRGGNVTRGYHNDPDGTAQLITPDGWLFTGDLGFLLGNRLTITGRAKDIIFVHGVNYYPHDIERVAEKVDGVELNKVVACGVRNEATEEEEVILFVRFVKPVEEFVPTARALKEHILQKVGISLEAVIPLAGQIPKTTSGKLQRFALAERYLSGEFQEVKAKVAVLLDGGSVESEAPSGQVEELEQFLEEEALRLLGVAAIDRTVPLFEQGMNSSRLVQFHKRISQKLQREVPIPLLFDYPSVRELAGVLEDGDRIVSAPGILSDRRATLRSGDNPVSVFQRSQIAVVGMACRFPGKSNSPEALWKLFSEGKDAISEIPADRWESSRYLSSDKHQPGTTYVNKGGIIDDVDKFDAPFFGITPVEAEAMDPQHRLLLETAWHALENAAIDPYSIKGARGGVFVGLAEGEYSQAHFRSSALENISQYAFTGSAASTGAGRISYTFGLHGPNMAIDTACSSSLVAIHQGAQSLRAGECDFVIAGGVNLLLSPSPYIALSRLGALSQSGECRTFDEFANGYVRGEGCGVVILKRYEDAVAQGDPILAVIRGSALTHDGRSNGLTAPNGRAQEDAIRLAHRASGVSPDEISYVETHGTGTPLGDPIELSALGRVFSTKTRKEPLLVGSVKSSIGHLESAAGVAGLIKLILCLNNEAIPPQTHFDTPSSKIFWNELSLRVPSILTPWPRSKAPRRAGLSSFGMSGTNVHLVIEEATAAAVREMKEAPLPFVLSAKSRDALAETAARLLEQGAPITDVCYSSALGRAHHSYRLATVASTNEELREVLSSVATKAGTSKCVVGEAKGAQQLGYLFSGQGSQYWGMGQELYQSYSAFRDVVDECSAPLEPQLGYSLKELLLTSGSDERFQDTAVTQPALFVFQCALAELWKSWGITPRAVLGHSIGEFAAAYTAGVFSLQDGLKLVAARGKLMQSLPKGGAMVAVIAGPSVVEEALKEYREKVTIAAYNSPENTVISGDAVPVEQVVAKLRERKIHAKLLSVSHAFHSPLVEPILKEFEAVARSVRLNAPRLPVISTCSGKAAEIYAAEYWVRQLRQPVRFQDSVETIAALATLLLEVGPSSTVAGLARQCLGDRNVPVLTSLRKGVSEQREFLRAVGELYVYGCDLNWNAVFSGVGARRVGLVQYPFERRRYWIDLAHQAPRKEASLSPTRLQPASGAIHMSEGLLKELSGIVAAVSRLDAGGIDVDRNFFEMGLDSLLVVQIRQLIQKKYGVEFEMSKFYEELSTIRKIAERLEEIVVVDADEGPGPRGPGPRPSNHDLGPGPSLEHGIERIIALQLETMQSLMKAQLEAARGQAVATAAPKKPEVAAHGPYKKIQTESRNSLTPQQQQHVAELTTQFNSATRSSKRMAAESRRVCANPRNVIGFKPEMKEMIYPITVAKADGSKIWDLDGREYIDVTMGFGVTLLGHNPPCIATALTKEIEAGMAVGPASRHTGAVASLISEMTGVERVAFFTTGTESVMAGVRIARMVTGRSKIVIFSDSYHGSFDGVLAAGGVVNGEPMSFPVAEGTLQKMVDDVIVLRYNDPASLEVIKKHAPEIAAVLVEPVASRKPSVVPGEFLHQLRAITKESGVVLFFDEIILGFRLHQAGAQAWFGVEADLVTYGKVVGGGTPIGILAGKAAFMDAVDGGEWHYGDSSVPGKKTAFVAGTFNCHPLTMAAARATLEYLKAEGPVLQQGLNAKTQKLCERLNRLYAEENAPIQMHSFGSLFRFEFKGELEILNYHLLTRGVYVWEGKNCFLSTAHTDEDCDRIVEAVRESLHAMRAGGFLSDGGPTQPSPKGPKEEGIPLSESQKEMWFLCSQSEENSLAYQETVPLLLNGKLSVRALEKAIAELANRHSLLRVTAIDGEVQRIRPDATLSLRRVDELTEEKAVEEWLRKEALEPFNLSEGPFARFALAKVNDSRSVLTLTAHHLIADGWSLGVMVQELGELYRAFCEGNSPRLPQPESYEKYLAWEKQSRNSEKGRRSVEYWREALKGASSLVLPADFQRDAATDPIGRRIRFVIDPVVAKEIKEGTKRQGSSLFMTFFANYALLLSRLAGREKVVIGFPAAAHSPMEAPSLVGQCTAMLPMVCDIDIDETPLQYTARLKKKLLEVYDHQACSFSSSNGDSEALQVPDIRVIFNLDRAVKLDFGTLETSILATPLSHVKFDLFLNVLECDDEFLVDLDYRADLFDEETVRGWYSLFVSLVRESLGNGEVKLSSLNWGERSRTRAAELILGTSSLVDRVKGFGASIPDRVALRLGAEQLTYENLDRRAQELGHLLAGAGVKPGSAVGILTDSPLRYIEALFSVWRIGAVAVPLFYGSTRPQLEMILRDARIEVVLTHLGLECLLPEEGLKILSLENEPYETEVPEGVREERIRAFEQEAFAQRRSSLATLAYSFAGDGSAIRVPIDFEALERQTLDLARHYRIKTGDTVCYLHAESSTPAQLTLTCLTAMGAGAELSVTFASGEVESLKTACRRLFAEPPDVVFLPLATWTQLTKVHDAEIRASFRDGKPRAVVLVDRSAPPRSLVHERQSYGSDFHLLIVPSELPVGGVVCSVLPTSSSQNVTGFLLDGAQAEIVDPWGLTAPLGALGELILGTRSWRSRTGMRARMLASGALEIRGAIAAEIPTGTQIISLDEIRRALLTAPFVLDGTVVLENEKLGAYVTLHQAPVRWRNVLRSLVRSYFTGAAVPQSFHEVASLPFNMRGEVETAGLKDLVISSEEPRPDLREPSADEAVVLGVWREVLGDASVGLDDNFFELGGQSLKASQIINRLNRQLGCALALRDLFQAPTAAALARRCREVHGAGVSTITPASLREYYPVSSAQKGLWTLDQIDPGLAAYNMPLVLSIEEGISVEKLAAAYDTLLRRHESLRTTFINVDGVPHQRITQQPKAGLAVRDLQHEANPAQKALEIAKHEIRAPFSLEDGPLIRLTVAICETKNGLARGLLILNMHHIISDGWSMRAVVDELLALYRREAQPVLSIQYKDYAVWEAGQIGSSALNDHRGYWRKKLSGVLSFLTLPSELPRPKVKTYNGESVKIRLGATLTRDSYVFASKIGATPFAVILSAIETVLADFSGQEDLIIGVPLVGRELQELENQVGYFVNNLPLRAQVDRSKSFADLAGTIQRSLTELHRYQGYPFAHLVEEFGGTRDTGRNPLFEVVVVMDDRKDAYAALERHGLRDLDIDTRTSQFDLTIYITEESNDVLLNVVYNTDVLTRGAVDRLNAALLDRLSAALIQPHSPLTQLEGKPAASLPAIQKLPRGRTSPLLSHQERLWFVDEFERGDLYEGSPVYYNMVAALHFDRAIDESVLTGAMRDLTLRHPALLTKMERTGDSLVQSRRDSCALSVRRHDFLVGEEIKALLLKEACTPFEFENKPLFRVTVFGMPDGKDLAALCVHHIVADTVSLAILGKELHALYHARKQGDTAQLPESEVTLEDYVAWQRTLPAAVRESQIAYWREELAGIPALELPVDRPRPVVHTYTTGVKEFSISPAAARKLSGWGDSDGQNIVLLSVFAALLGRYSRQRDIVIGVPCRAGRKETEGLAAPLANLLVIRSELHKESTFDDFVAQVQGKVSRAQLNQDLPFDDLVLALNPKNDMSRTALFDVMFQLSGIPAETVSLMNGACRVEVQNVGWGKYDLNLGFSHENGTVRGFLVYNRDLFDADTIDRLASHFQVLLEGALDDPGKPVLELPILTNPEEAREASRPKRTGDSQSTIHALFEAQAARTPQNIAVECEGEEISYAELNARVNQLANLLISYGVTVDSLVGVYFERSIDLIVAFLGILKAGGAYVPIDPAYPAERASFMLEDSGTKILLTSGALRGKLPVSPDVRVLTPEMWNGSAGNPAPRGRPDSLAYIIYTSGSTGRPKGVMVEHGNVTSLMSSNGDLFDFTAADVWTLFHSPCFDFSVWEMYGALLFGGSVVIVPKLVAQDARAFRELLAAKKVTVLNQTPSAFYALLQEEFEHSSAALSIRYVIFGGEALKPGLLADWHQRYPETKLINMYGITETTVHVTYKEITDREIRENVSNIGVPISTLAVHIVDEFLKPVPTGVVGELCVSGDGVSRGYLNRSELTSERFPENTSYSDRRIYRSGDLAKRLPDGELIYLGRMDDQIKIRGFRIELGEIERRVLEYSGITESVTLVLEDGKGEKSLRTIFTADSAVSLAELRRFLAQILPEYMVPASFIQVDSIPRTINGKADKKALLALKDESRGRHEAEVLEEGSTEAALFDIWKEVLGRSDISFTDNFFEIGGHSLRATQVVSRIQRRLGAAISLKDFFTTPTLRELTPLVVERRRSLFDDLVALPEAEHYPASFAQRRLWLVDQVFGSSEAYNSYGAFSFRGDLNVQAFKQAVALLIDRHESLKTTIVAVDGEPRQKVNGPSFSVLDVVDLRGTESPDEMIRRRIEQEMVTPFDLARGPIIRSVLFQTPPEGGQQQWTWVVTIHHIATDGWSVGVFIRDLAELYEACCEKRAHRLPALPVQYKDYAEWQRKLLTGDKAKVHRSYWRDKFTGDLTPLSLPIDSPRPNRQTFSGTQLPFAIESGLLREMKALCSEQKVTLFMLLQAALKLMLLHRTGEGDITVGSPVAGREHVSLENQIGFYVNTLPLRDRLESDETFLSLLQKVKTTSTEALSHQLYPFDLLVEDLSLSRDTSRHPLFDVMLILQNNEPLKTRMGSVEIELLPEESRTSKFDLNFMFEEKERLHGTLEYNTDLYEERTAQSLISDLIALIGAAVSKPDATLREICASCAPANGSKSEEQFVSSLLNVSDQF